jgi:hypothetical protein
MSNSQKVAVFGDLTALYATRSKRERSINYSYLDAALKRVAGVDSFDESVWFTLFSEGNERQVSFVQGLRDLDWEVETKLPHTITKKNRFDSMNYRFDSQISYYLGLSVEYHNKVIVVSDSFELYDSLQKLREDDQKIDICLAFYPDGLDGRWWKQIRSQDSFLTFIDLEEEINNYARLLKASESAA